MTDFPVPFYKMNGIGNAIIVADMRDVDVQITPAAAVALSSDMATQFDQLMAVHKPAKPGEDALIRIYNCDGTRAGACGNGTRCVVQWLAYDTGQSSFSFNIDGERVTATTPDGEIVSVDMGVPRFDWTQIPLSEEFADTRGIELQIGPIDDPVLHTPSVMNIGNPHAVFWVSDDVWSYDLEKFGPLLENHPLFPEKANITLAQVTGEDDLTIRTWERGAGLTLACGSAACAAAVCGARTGRTARDVTVHLPGGSLAISWRNDNHVIMTGDAEYEFAGTLDPITGRWTYAPDPVIEDTGPSEPAA